MLVGNHYRSRLLAIHTADRPTSYYNDRQSNDQLTDYTIYDCLSIYSRISGVERSGYYIYTTRCHAIITFMMGFDKLFDQRLKYDEITFDGLENHREFEQQNLRSSLIKEMRVGFII